MFKVRLRNTNSTLYLLLPGVTPQFDPTRSKLQRFCSRDDCFPFLGFVFVVAIVVVDTEDRLKAKENSRFQLESLNKGLQGMSSRGDTEGASGAPTRRGGHTGVHKSSLLPRCLRGPKHSVCNSVSQPCSKEELRT